MIAKHFKNEIVKKKAHTFIYLHVTIIDQYLFKDNLEAHHIVVMR